MSAKVKTNIATLCASGLSLFYASAAGDTSVARLIYTALGLAFLAVAIFMASRGKRLWIFAAAAVVAVLYGIFATRSFYKIDMGDFIPDGAAVEHISLDGWADDGDFFCFWTPGEGQPVFTDIDGGHLQILGGSADFSGLRQAVFYTHWIPEPTEHFSPWADRLSIALKCPDGRRVKVSIYDSFDFHEYWDLYIDDYQGSNPYNSSNNKRYCVRTNADLSELIPEDVFRMILSGDRSVAIPAGPGVNTYDDTEWIEDYNGRASLETKLERADDGTLLLNCAVKSEWEGEETPDSMAVAVELYAKFPSSPEPVLLDSDSKSGDRVKTRFFSMREVKPVEASAVGEEPEWIEIRQKTVFIFGDEEHTIEKSIRYES